MGVNYLEIKQLLQSNRYSNNKSRIFSDILFKIEELVDVDTIRFFYPKNLFVVDKDLEAYLVFEDKILWGRMLPNKSNNNFVLEILRFKDITDLKYDCSCCRDGFHKLTIKFKNGTTIVFNSMEDTNSSWCHKFEDLIKDLLKFLIKNY